METMQSRYQHEKYRTDETLSQQTKLIDFLQDKVESTPRKKKGLFPPTRHDMPVPSIQLRETQQSLAHERDKCASLRLQIVQLQDELNQAKTELHRMKSLQPSTRQVLSQPTTSLPSTTPQSSLTLPTPRRAGHNNQPVIYNELSTKSPSIQKRPLSERPMSERPMSERPNSDHPLSDQKPQHRFITGINSRATQCIVCLGAIHFVHQAARCRDCGAVCHPKCLPDLPWNCGLQSDYTRYMTDMMSRARAISVEGDTPSVARLNLQLSAQMKVPRSQKQTWEIKWVALKDNKLFVYHCQEDFDKSAPLDEFDLCPSNGEVSVRNAVTTAELTTVSPSDLPYILMVEFEPETTCWPARSMYLMAQNFHEKQLWVATLEAIVNTNANSKKIKDVKVLGNTMLRLGRDTRLEFNCTWPLNDEVILIGAGSGLYAMQLTKTAESRPLVRVNGINGVHAIEAQTDMDFILIVEGQDRDLKIVDLGDLRRSITAPSSKELVPALYIEDATACTVFAVGRTASGLFLCVATAENILLYKYNSKLKTFCLRKEISTSQPCSCLHFGQQSVIFGTDKFYQLQLDNSSVAEFLDKTDASLAFAVYGAAQYHSFPIAVLAVNEPTDPDEFLVCFHEFGVFVNGAGQRTRDQNIKWTGLPLAFAYHAPFLYTIHFNALQVLQIMTPSQQIPVGMKTFVNIPGAQYLGPAVTQGAIYVGSSHQLSADILCIMGNRAVEAMKQTTKENVPVYAVLTKSQTKKKKVPTATLR